MGISLFLCNVSGNFYANIKILFDYMRFLQDICVHTYIGKSKIYSLSLKAIRLETQERAKVAVQIQRLSCCWGRTVTLVQV